ncbi:MAG: hypothetical protein L3J76_01270 [Candidatus Hydrothermae bacterium]|nr:hypothetical protein [Candidatus Hydrothermae bacterium]
MDRVYFVDMPGLKEVLDRMKALGVTGNRPFWERTLVLDVPGGTWGVLPAEVLHDSR